MPAQCKVAKLRESRNFTHDDCAVELSVGPHGFAARDLSSYGGGNGLPRARRFEHVTQQKLEHSEVRASR
eukprot:1113527-Alexandrium_andersonii.AAC.1